MGNKLELLSFVLLRIVTYTPVARQWPVKCNRGKVFPTWLCDATTEGLLGEVFSM